MAGSNAALLACSSPAPLSPPLNPQRLSSSTSLMREPSDRRDDSGSSRVGDKSCETCKVRKVRCDRTFGQCKRCIRRNETCVYPADTVFEAPHDRLRLAQLESELASLVQRLNTDSGASAPRTLAAASPFFSKESSRILPDLSTSILLALISGTHTERACLQLSEYFHERSGVATAPEVGHSRLGRLLVVTLIETYHSMCWSRIPAFQGLEAALDKCDLTRTDLSLDAMDPAAQVALVILCALGASCKPQAGIFGFRLDLATATLSEIAVVGATREHVCRRLMDLAWDVGGRLGLFWPEGASTIFEGGVGVDRYPVVGVLLAWSQWLTIQDFRPVRSRWLLRNALDLFQDLELAGEDLRGLKHTAGSVFMTLDATISSKMLTPSLIPPHLANVFLEESSHLGTANSFPLVIHSLGRNPQINRMDIDVAIGATRRSISECQARFASAVDYSFNTVRMLWQTIDRVHSSVQSLQHVLAGLSYTPQGCEGDDRALDDYILLAVRLDLQLIDLCNTIHTYLGRAELTAPGGVAELVAMRSESDQRMRKCLKLVALYSQFFLSSGDKYLVSQLFVQLDRFPDWTTLATQRVGWVPGPAAVEFELTEEELDWIATGLRNACFYATAPAVRLKEISVGRGQLPPLYPYGFYSPQFSADGSVFSTSSSTSPASIAPIYRQVSSYGPPDFMSPYISELDTGTSAEASKFDYGDPSRGGGVIVEDSGETFILPTLGWMDFDEFLPTEEGGVGRTDYNYGS